MKKSVILTILVMYLFAIIIVGFVGVKLKIYDETRYVEKIICTNSKYVELSESEKDKLESTGEEIYDGYIFVLYTEGLKVDLKFDVLPENANNKKLNFVYPQSDGFTLENTSDTSAILSFSKPDSVTIRVTSNDNSGVSIVIKVSAI